MNIFRCWANYNYLGYYWIIDGPRYAVMIVSLSSFSYKKSNSFFIDKFYIFIEHNPRFID
jgi:hypothetical protein